MFEFWPHARNGNQLFKIAVIEIEVFWLCGNKISKNIDVQEIIKL